MSNHTPGPWKVVNHGQHWNNRSILNWAITYGNDGEQIVDHVYNEVDARLIAAAPDMLAILRSLAECCKVNDRLLGSEHQAQICAAIAKAEGRA